MPRCEDCNLFVSYADEPEVDVDGAELNEESLDATVTVKLCCGECGTELKEAYLEYHADVDPCECGSHYELDDFEVEPSTKVETVGKSGKTLKHPKVFYGADITYTLKCETCGDSANKTVTDSIHESPKYFDEV